MSKKILAMMIAVIMVVGMLPMAVLADDYVAQIGSTKYTTFAEAVNDAGEDDTIQLLANVTLTSAIYNKPLTIDLNSKTLFITDYVRFNGNTKVFGGTINADNAYSSDGIICANYHNSNANTLTLQNITVSAKNVKYTTGLFYIYDSDNTLILDNVTVNVSGQSSGSGSGVFYSGSSFNRGNVVIKNNTTITAENVDAIFFATEVNLDGATITCSDVHRPVFRQVSGTVENSTITVESIDEGQALIADVKGNNSGVIKFENTTMTAPEDTPVTNLNNEGSNVIADPESSIGDGEGVSAFAASVDGVNYVELEDALKALTSGAELKLLSDITIDTNWDRRSTGATITVPATINGNGHTIRSA